MVCFSHFHKGMFKSISFLMNLFHIQMAKLECTKKGFQYAGIKAWNNMPISIKELSSPSLFKSHLKKYFMSNEN